MIRGSALAGRDVSPALPGPVCNREQTAPGLPDDDHGIPSAST